MADIYPIRPVTAVMHGGIWAVIGGAAPIAASQTVTSNNGVEVLIALITAGSAVFAAWIASRYRNNKHSSLSDDEIIVSRDEWERLRALERHHEK